MAFDRADFVRIEGEFLSLAGGDHWDRVEQGLWLRRQLEHAAWSAHGQWWRSTTLGKRTTATSAKVRTARLKTVVVAIRGCRACGKPFELTAAQREHGRGRVCSAECRGRTRQNIELVRLHGEALSLARWAERYGVALKTVCKRRKLGWSVLDALSTPVRGQGRAA